MLLFTKRPGERAQVRFMPGCLVMSLLLSIVLTVLINILITALIRLIGNGQLSVHLGF